MMHINFIKSLVNIKNRSTNGRLWKIYYYKISWEKYIESVMIPDEYDFDDLDG